MRLPHLQEAGSPSRGRTDDKYIRTQMIIEITVLIRVEAIRTYKGGLKTAWRNPRRLLGGSASEAEM